MTDPENHTIRLLQEMREDNRAFRQDVIERFDRIDDRFADLETRFDRIDSRLDTLEQVFSGLGFITADTRGEIEALKARLDKLEAQQ